MRKRTHLVRRKLRKRRKLGEEEVEKEVRTW